MNPINSNLNQKFHPNFQARHIAQVITKAGNVKKEIQLYNLDESDKRFARKMLKAIDLRKLYPSTNEKDYAYFPAWKTLIKGAVDRIGHEQVILAVQDNIPCGIMSFRHHNAEMHLSRIATWNIKPATKVEHAGKTLMHEIFRDASANKIRNINLVASSIQPRGRSCINFYSKMGFVNTQPLEPNYFEMPHTNYAMKCAQLENFFTYKKIDNPEEVKLRNKISLSFEDTKFEKFIKYIKSLIQKYTGNRS